MMSAMLCGRGLWRKTPSRTGIPSCGEGASSNSCTRADALVATCRYSSLHPWPAGLFRSSFLRYTCTGLTLYSTLHTVEILKGRTYAKVPKSELTSMFGVADRELRVAVHLSNVNSTTVHLPEVTELKMAIVLRVRYAPNRAPHTRCTTISAG